MKYKYKMHLMKTAGNTNIKIKINKINFGLKVSKKIE